MSSKQDLIRKASTIASVDRETTRRVIDAYHITLVEAVDQAQVGDKVELRGLVTLQRVATPERSMRNPKTGEPVLVPAGTKVKAKVSAKIN